MATSGFERRLTWSERRRQVGGPWRTYSVGGKEGMYVAWREGVYVDG